MPKVNSINELIELRSRILADKDTSIPTIVISAGTCGQASGANDLIRVTKRELINNGLVVSYVEFGEQYELSYTKSSGNSDQVNSNLVAGWNLVSVKIGDTTFNPDNLPEVPVKVEFYSNGTGQMWINNYGVFDAIDQRMYLIDLLFV